MSYITQESSFEWPVMYGLTKNLETPTVTHSICEIVTFSFSTLGKMSHSHAKMSAGKTGDTCIRSVDSIRAHILAVILCYSYEMLSLGVGNIRDLSIVFLRTACESTVISEHNFLKFL